MARLFLGIAKKHVVVYLYPLEQPFSTHQIGTRDAIHRDIEISHPIINTSKEVAYQKLVAIQPIARFVYQQVE